MNVGDIPEMQIAISYCFLTSRDWSTRDLGVFSLHFMEFGYGLAIATEFNDWKVIGNQRE